MEMNYGRWVNSASDDGRRERVGTAGGLGYNGEGRSIVECQQLLGLYT